ncbi:MAG: Crp/Fnr family transcriptional regulator [Phenylobacterium sp.]|nr:Crp/Fnr family transcriptional regulator [Phenylobacterium sp.]
MQKTNHFLDTLPAKARALIEPDLERVTLKRDDTLAEVGRTVEMVLLPTDSIISVIAVMANGDQVESRTIGRESGFGLLHALGSPYAFERVIVQVGGEAWKIRTETLRRAAAASPMLTDAIIRHAQATIVQTAQTNACNALHATPLRLARWLLMTQDRLGGDAVVPLTQEHLAIMLGVQRTTVTTLAASLQAEKIIRYSRGKIRILDREALTGRACECYETVTLAVDRILADRVERAA